MGLFSVAKEVGSTVPNTLVAPLNRAVMPGYARIAHHPELLRDGYRAMLGMVAIVTVPASVGIAALAALIVPVTLGSKWLAAVPLLGILSLASMSRSLTASTISVHYAMGQPRQQTLITGIQAVTLLPVVAGGLYLGGLPGAAWAYLLHAMLIFLPVCYVILFRTTPIRLSDTVQPLWRPVLASAVMYAVVKPLSDALAVPGSWQALPRLAALAVVGLAAYIGAAALLWWFSGQPEGAEKALLRRLPPRLGRLLPRGLA